MAQNSGSAESSRYLSMSPDEVTPEVMDAAIGYMNRRLQSLMDGIGEGLNTLGAFCKGSLGRVCSEYADGGDFYRTMLGVQVRVFFEGTGADSDDKSSLGQIVRNRNHFLYKYPKILRNSGGKVPAGEFNLLRDTISAIDRRTAAFAEAFEKRIKIQSKAQTMSAGKNSVTKFQTDLEKIKRAIDNAVPRDRTMIPLSRLTSLVQAVVPGQDVGRVLGKKLKTYLEESKEYCVRDTNGGLKVGRNS